VEVCIRNNGGELLRDIKLFDVFRSEKIGAGLKQYAVSLRFNHPERTLTDEEVNAAIESILNTAAAELDAKLRDW
jgi:phenylalanyl-tRNA synthetase beta chain